MQHASRIRFLRTSHRMSSSSRHPSISMLSFGDGREWLFRIQRARWGDRELGEARRRRLGRFIQFFMIRSWSIVTHRRRPPACVLCIVSTIKLAHAVRTVSASVSHLSNHLAQVTVLTSTESCPVEYTPQAYLQSDLDMFNRNFSSALVGKSPTLVSIDGGEEGWIAFALSCHADCVCRQVLISISRRSSTTMANRILTCSMQ